MSQEGSSSSETLRRATVAIRVMPRAKHNEIVEILDDGTVKVRLTAPPVDGKANRALIEYFAEFLGLSKSKIEILSGTTSRNKRLSVLGMNASELLEKIQQEVKR